MEDVVKYLAQEIVNSDYLWSRLDADGKINMLRRSMGLSPVEFSVQTPKRCEPVEQEEVPRCLKIQEGCKSDALFQQMRQIVESMNTSQPLMDSMQQVTELTLSTQPKDQLLLPENPGQNQVERGSLEIGAIINSKETGEQLVNEFHKLEGQQREVNSESFEKGSKNLNFGLEPTIGWVSFLVSQDRSMPAVPVANQQPALELDQQQFDLNLEASRERQSQDRNTLGKPPEDSDCEYEGKGLSTRVVPIQTEVASKVFDKMSTRETEAYLNLREIKTCVLGNLNKEVDDFSKIGIKLTSEELGNADQSSSWQNELMGGKNRFPNSSKGLSSEVNNCCAIEVPQFKGRNGLIFAFDPGITEWPDGGVWMGRNNGILDPRALKLGGCVLLLGGEWLRVYNSLLSDFKLLKYSLIIRVFDPGGNFNKIVLGLSNFVEKRVDFVHLLAQISDLLAGFLEDESRVFSHSITDFEFLNSIKIKGLVFDPGIGHKLGLQVVLIAGCWVLGAFKC